MTVYVDEIKTYEDRGRLSGEWSHMMADTHDELMSMARRIGMRSGWIQHVGLPTEHFDVRPSMRAKAVRCGALEVSGREQAKLVSIPKAEAARAARGRATQSALVHLDPRPDDDLPFASYRPVPGEPYREPERVFMCCGSNDPDCPGDRPECRPETVPTTGRGDTR